MKDIMLSGYLSDFSQLNGFSELPESEQFGHFVNYCAISQFSYDDINLLDVNVDGSHDLGIDGIIVLVNGHCISSVEDVDYFVEKLKRIDVEFLFIQSKMGDSFKGHEIGTFISGVTQFFSNSCTMPVNDEVQEYINIKNYIYKKYSIRMNRAPVSILVYATTGVWVDDPSLVGRIENDTIRLKQDGNLSDVLFLPYDAEKLKRIYRNLRKKIEREVIFDRYAVMPAIDDVTESYIGIIEINQFLRLIIDDDGEVQKSVFYDNIRDYQGENQVNKEIAKTVSDSSAQNRFPVLNNGVTIVAQSITKIGDKFRINNYQIVNGCQTCHVLINNKHSFDNSFYIPLKLVVTDKQNIINDITVATNRQTAVLPEAFESLSPFHQTLEDFYNSKKGKTRTNIYYERRSKQYLYDDISPNQVVSLANQTTTFVAMFLNQPHSTHRYYGELLSSYSDRMYKVNHSPYPYFVSALANAIVHDYFFENRLSNIRKFRFHVLMLMRIRITGEEMPSFSSTKINSVCDDIVKVLNNKAQCDALIKECCTSIKEKICEHSNDGIHLDRSRAFTESLLSHQISRPTGIIIYYNSSRGFGFLRSDVVVGDIFFHIYDVAHNDLTKIASEAKFEFDLTQNDKGYVAKALTFIDA